MGGEGKLTGGKSAVVGGMSGVIEVLINQPTVAWKNALQQSRPLVVTPRELYRGVSINALSMAPITAVQFGANQVISSTFGDDPTLAQKFISSSLAGALSGLVSGPAELVMIRQQRRKSSLSYEIRNSLLKTPFKGFWLAAARDSIFVAGYLAVSPLFGAEVSRRLAPNPKNPPAWCGLLGSAGAGVLAGTASHCFDTMKTAVQGAEKGEPNTTIAATRMLMKRGGGVKALYSGLFPRGLRITIGVMVLSECNQRLPPLVFPREFV